MIKFLRTENNKQVGLESDVPEINAGFDSILNKNLEVQFYEGDVITCVLTKEGNIYKFSIVEK